MEKPVFRPSGQMVLLMGIPATGKSTFVGTFLCSTHAHVSLDLLGTRRREFDALQAALADGGSAAVDDTNVTEAVRRPFIQAAKTAGYEVIGIFFRSVIREAVERNERRTGKAKVPRTAIANFSNRLEMPRLEEGFSSLWFAQTDGCGGFLVTPWKEAEQ